jgi:hypothetical protein
MDLAEIHAAEAWLEAVDVGTIADDGLRKLAVTLERLRNRLEAVDVAVLAELDERGACLDEGALSAAGWLSAHTGSPVHDVRRRQRTGAAVRLLPGAGVAVRSGVLSPEHLRRLADCVRHHPDRAASEADALVRLAASLPAGEFAVAARDWCYSGGAERPDRELSDRVTPTSKVRHWRTLDRTLRLEAEFHGDDADLVEAALEGRFDQLLRAARDGDTSLDGLDYAEVRAQGLIDLLAQTQRREPGERSQPDRYRVAVIVQATDNPDTAASPAAAVALCDSSAYRAVLNDRSEVLDIGRDSRLWTPAIRRAITLRDGRCVFPGCDRPPSWCDVHHCQEWGDVGETKVDNGALLCRRHHTFVHAERWRVSIPQPRSRPQVHRPDGSVFRVDRWARPEASVG